MLSKLYLYNYLFLILSPDLLKNKFDDCSMLFDLFKYGPVEHGGGDGGDNEPSSGKHRD